MIDVGALKQSVSKSVEDVSAEIYRQRDTLQRLVSKADDPRTEGQWERAQLLVNDLRRLTAKLAGLRSSQ